ncbi:MAG: hypothetical protein HY300_19425, partial [Verrucomicrobia bacterium]|nr:hypothetical protein [Verrucomicrobiota bacterium]
EIEAWLRFDSAAFQGLIEQQARRKKLANESEVSRVVASATQANGGAIGNKPKRPKEVFESVLAEFGIPRSNSLYGRLAKQEALSGCTVWSFNRFIQILKGWFPLNPTR